MCDYIPTTTLIWYEIIVFSMCRVFIARVCLCVCCVCVCFACRVCTHMQNYRHACMCIHMELDQPLIQSISAYVQSLVGRMHLAKRNPNLCLTLNSQCQCILRYTVASIRYYSMASTAIQFLIWEDQTISKTTLKSEVWINTCTKI